MVANRRWLHQHPELSFEEVESAAYVVRQLESYGITEIYQKVGVTGVVAMIRGEGGAGPTVGLRADMDALPVQETRSDIDYASVNP
jgi:hippurate hydrolase